jgi:hypothetical protein
MSQLCWLWLLFFGFERPMVMKKKHTNKQRTKEKGWSLAHNVTKTEQAPEKSRQINDENKGG